MNTVKKINTIVQNALGTLYASLCQKLKIMGIFDRQPSLEEQQLVLPCTHDWVLISKTYAPPVKGLQTTIEDIKVLEKALFGLTTYLWECRVCSAIRKEEALGSDENQLDELVDKVEKLGMQYIKEGDNTYAIAKVPPSDEPRVPLR